MSPEEKKERRKYLSKRIDITCDSKNAKHKERESKSRSRYGVCRCDSFSLDYTLGIVMSNYLYQYLADAKYFIERGDWDKIEQCADCIRDYAKMDGWSELLNKEDFDKKRQKFKESLDWLYENWNSLWW